MGRCEEDCLKVRKKAKVSSDDARKRRVCGLLWRKEVLRQTFHHKAPVLKHLNGKNENDPPPPNHHTTSENSAISRYFLERGMVKSLTFFT